MPRLALACALALLTFPLLCSPAASQSMTTERVASGLRDPVYVTAPEGDPDRLFIVEQNGVIRILKNGSLLPTPFLDIQSRVNNTFTEQGLLGLAFHPDYDQNGYFFVYYIGGSSAGVSRLRRFTVSANPDVADDTTLYTILNIPQPFTNHNGGQIEFGPDGYLYVGMGDGGSANDPQGNGQNPLTLLGKMLRIDVDNDDFPTDVNRNYAIPPTNPFLGNPATKNATLARS